jgi:hypothetical protein
MLNPAHVCQLAADLRERTNLQVNAG